MLIEGDVEVPEITQKEVGVRVSLGLGLGLGLEKII